MDVFDLHLIDEFIFQYPNSRASLDVWLRTMQQSKFKHFNDLKQAFGSADYVKPHTIFNISGNKYRLISVITYSVGTTKIKHILTHAEYDKAKWRNL